MGDRRKEDRRTKERGVISVPLKDAIFWIVAVVVFFILIFNNVVLFIRYKQTQEDLYYYKDYYNIDNGNEYSYDYDFEE